MKQKFDVPFWEDSFRQEVESSEIGEGILLWYFSGAVFAVRTPDSMIYIDPYFGGDPVEGAPNTYRATAVAVDPSKIKFCDAAFITHNHYDHCHEETLPHFIENTNATIYGPISVIEEMRSYNLPEDRIKLVKPGDRLSLKDVNVTVYPAYDKDEPQAVTYTVESQGIKTLFCGDSAAGPELEKITDIDVVTMAFGRTWYMSEEEMLDAAQRLSPKLLLPCHWELWRGHTGDILKLGRLIEQRDIPFDVQMLLIGDYLHYKPNGEYIKGR